MTKATSMDYSLADQWILRESFFDRGNLGKAEAVFSLGNGYMGLRSATEEGYFGERRGLFVAGTFNCCEETEVTELPNGPDVIGMEFTLNGQRFALDSGKIKNYSRTLNLKTGELTRKIIWEAPDGAEYEFDFYRFVSREKLSLIGQKVVFRPLSADVELKLCSGINGQMTNSGAQHFREMEKRSFERKYFRYTCETTQSKVLFVASQVHRFFRNGKAECVTPVPAMGRRRIFGDYVIALKKSEELTIEKLSAIHHSRNKLLEEKSTEEIKEYSLDFIQEAEKSGYDTLFEESKAVWENEWEKAEIRVTSENPFDQLAIRFAQYHLSVMTPSHDSRMSIGAKGLSGEGYKGHTFWDCDQFVLPYFIFTFPEKAKKLETYRYKTLDGARKKAALGGYDGAQFPWESAWVEDGEVTPAFGDADLITGLPQVIWTGKIEQHITADVAYGVWQYADAWGDEAFLDDMGWEIILDTAKFWCSRLEEGADGLFHINDVIGPDEYKEHVDDNAYTNYMAWWNMKKAAEGICTLKKNKVSLYEKLDRKLDIQKLEKRLLDCISRMYLPKADESGLMAQDASYLTLKEIDLRKYKEQDYVLGIYKDYNAEQLNGIQVSKQADILILFYLLENFFDDRMKKRNYTYYEAKTLHDSSLSLSTHCILASDLGETETAYTFFKDAASIDMGPNMKSSDDGIHSASIGGIWQCLIFGFAGVRLIDGKLRIRPRLPKEISEISFPLCWKGERLRVTVKGENIRIEKLAKGEVNEYLRDYQS